MLGACGSSFLNVLYSQWNRQQGHQLKVNQGADVKRAEEREQGME